MTPSHLIAALGFATLIYGNAIHNAASPATVPEATPSGCSKAAFSLSPSEVKKATAGCEDISLEGGVRNDIIDALPCKPVTLLFARGTGEKGNIGQLVGPPFILALEKQYGNGNVAVQGVNDYPAAPLDYCSGGRAASSRRIDTYKALTRSLPFVGSITGSQYLAWVRQTLR